MFYSHFPVGTIRYDGFSKAVKTLQAIGLLDPEPHPSLHSQGPDITWRHLVCNLLGLQENTIYENLKANIASRTQSEYSVEVLEDLGLLDDAGVIKMSTPLDTLTHFLSAKLNLGTLQGFVTNIF